jgi:iron complex transport system permease protein
MKACISSRHRRGSALAAAWLLWLTLAAALLALLGAGIGSTGFESVLNARHDPLAWQIVMDIRLPRTAAAWLAGGLLGLAGAVAQGRFATPWPILICWAVPRGIAGGGAGHGCPGCLALRWPAWRAGA